MDERVRSPTIVSQVFARMVSVWAQLAPMGFRMAMKVMWTVAAVAPGAA